MKYKYIAFTMLLGAMAIPGMGAAQTVPASAKKLQPTLITFSIDKGTERESLGKIQIESWRSVAGKYSLLPKSDGDLMIALFKKGSGLPTAIVPLASLVSAEWVSLNVFLPNRFATNESKFEDIDTTQLWKCDKGAAPTPQTCFQPSTGTITMQPISGAVRVQPIQYFSDLWALAISCSTSRCPKRELVQKFALMSPDEYQSLFTSRNAEYSSIANAEAQKQKVIANAEREKEKIEILDRINNSPAGAVVSCESTTLLIPGRKLSEVTFQCIKLANKWVIPLKDLIAAGWYVTDESRTPTLNQIGERADKIWLQLRKS